MAALEVASILLGGGVSLFNSISNRQGVDEANRANRALYDLQYQRSLQMQNMQNAYNSPSSQMDRFVSAGLNPHLVYGQSGSSPASTFIAPQAPSSIPKRHELDVAQSVNALNAALSFKRSDAEIENIQAQTEALKAQANLTNKQYDKETYYVDVIQPLEKILTDRNIDKMDQDMLYQAIAAIDEHNYRLVMNDQAKYTFDEYKDNRKVRDALLNGSLDQLNKALDEADSRIRSNDASAALAASGVGLNKAMTSKIIADIENTVEDTKTKAVNRKFLERTLNYRIQVEKWASKIGAFDAYQSYMDALNKEDFVQIDKSYRRLQMEIMRRADSRAERDSWRAALESLHAMFTTNTQGALSAIDTFK